MVPISSVLFLICFNSRLQGLYALGMNVLVLITFLSHSRLLTLLFQSKNQTGEFILRDCLFMLTWHFYYSSKFFFLMWCFLFNLFCSPDYGIFVIKFLELFMYGVDLREEFSDVDIRNIRVQLNELLQSQHNIADISMVKECDRVCLFLSFFILCKSLFIIIFY